jgi:hypothetical protein
MRVTKHFLRPVTASLQQLADLYALDLHVYERSGEGNLPRFYASFESVETKEPGVLVSTYGNGDTPEQAVADYAHQLSGRVLVIRSHQPSRREIGPFSAITFDGKIE